MICQVILTAPGPAPYEHRCGLEAGHSGRHRCRTCQTTWKADR